jgi:hypothetical protein
MNAEHCDGTCAGGFSAGTFRHKDKAPCTENACGPLPQPIQNKTGTVSTPHTTRPRPLSKTVKNDIDDNMTEEADQVIATNNEQQAESANKGQEGGKESKLSPLDDLVTGLVAGVPAAWLTCPLDVIKTRMQSLRHRRPADGCRVAVGSFSSTTAELWAEGGVAAFLKVPSPPCVSPFALSQLTSYLTSHALFLSSRRAQ